MTITGCDLSVYQHPGGAKIDYRRAVKAGIDFAIIEFGDAAGERNPHFLEDHEGFRLAGAVTGSYYFVRPELDPHAEAVTLRELAVYGPVWADLETFGGSSPAGIREFWGELATGAPHVNLVTYPAFIAENGPFGHSGSLWVDSFGAKHPPEGALIWGMTDKAEVPGIPVPLDLDAFTSTSAVLLQLFGPRVSPFHYKGVTFEPSTLIIAGAGIVYLGVPSQAIAKELEDVGARLVHNPNAPKGAGLFLEVLP